MNEKFDWNPGISAPENYPMEPYQVDFVSPDSSSTGAFCKPVGYATPWGDNGSSASVGSNLKAIPVRLDITWLSYTENQFYTGSFQLPYDTILALFKKGWPDFNYSTNPPTPITKTFNEITVGMAPGGVVVVWLSGTANRIDVGRFQAQKTNFDMKKFAPYAYTSDQNVYVKKLVSDSAVSDNLAKNGIPYGLWDKYRQRFIMRPVIIYDWPTPIKTSQLVLDYYSGEEETLDSTTIQKNEYASRVRPQKFNFYWYVDWAGKKQGYQLPIEFNEAEIMKAYAEIYGSATLDNKIQADLIVEVNRGNDEFRVFLQGNGKKIELLQSKGEIYLSN
ncbi:MAG TPA: DUF2931 family protein [Ferruginibacter sp.]|nr:DUF2931 family protein [Ferruginibacter sp.]